MNEIITITEQVDSLKSIVEDTVSSNNTHMTILYVILLFAFFLTNKLIDYYQKKNSTKPLNKITETLDSNCRHLDRLTNVLTSYIYDATEGNETKCKAVISLSFTAFKSNLFEFSRNVILNNNINKNSQLVKENIRQMVQTEYYTVFTSLALFDIDGTNVTSYLNSTWMDELSDSVINIIFKDLEEKARIDAVYKRLELKINGYKNYVHNKIFSK